jgi:hypothetical protein
VRYTIRIGIEREKWSVNIYPGGLESVTKRVSGAREAAEFHARSMIDRWLQKRCVTHLGQSRQNISAHDAEQK